MFTTAGENGPESVFAIQFAADAGQSFNGNLGGTLNFPGGGPFGSCCGFFQPTIDLANAFRVDANGLPLFDAFNDDDFLYLAIDDPGNTALNTDDQLGLNFDKNLEKGKPLLVGNKRQLVKEYENTKR